MPGARLSGTSSSKMMSVLFRACSAGIEQTKIKPFQNTNNMNMMGAPPRSQAACWMAPYRGDGGTSLTRTPRKRGRATLVSSPGNRSWPRQGSSRNRASSAGLRGRQVLVLLPQGSALLGQQVAPPCIRSVNRTSATSPPTAEQMVTAKNLINFLNKSANRTQGSICTSRRRTSWAPASSERPRKAWSAQM